MKRELTELEARIDAKLALLEGRVYMVEQDIGLVEAPLPSIPHLVFLTNLVNLRGKLTDAEDEHVLKPVEVVKLTIAYHELTPEAWNALNEVDRVMLVLQYLPNHSPDFRA